MPRLRKADRDQVMGDTRRRLLEAAAAEFARAGYVGANINRISVEAGFAKGTVYNYFPSKRALLLDLLGEVAEAQTTFILQRVREEQDPGRRLQRFFEAGLAFVEQNPTRSRVIIQLVYGPDVGFRAQVYRAYGPLLHAIVHEIIELGIARGDFRPVDGDLAAASVMSLYLGSCSQLEPEGRIWLDPGQVAGLLLDGLRPRSAQASPVV